MIRVRIKSSSAAPRVAVLQGLNLVGLNRAMKPPVMCVCVCVTCKSPSSLKRWTEASEGE